MKNVIAIKQLLSIDDVMDRVRMMGEFALSIDLAFDFTGLQYVRTVPAALFARELRLLISKRQKAGLKTYSTGHDDDKSAALSYLAFIGFFDFIGLPNFGQKVRATAEVSGRYPYLAITKYNYQRFKIAAEYDPYRTEYDYISEEARKIAELLKTTDVRNSLFGYAVCEVLRNAYEHSGFGLYVLSEFAKRYGIITIVSGTDLVSQTADNERLEKVSDDGTLVGIYLKTIPPNAKELIEKIITDGEKISILSDYPVRPSKQTWNF